MKKISLLFLAVAAGAVSCERHEFEGPKGTKQLNEPHGAAAHGAHSAAEEHPGAAEKKPAH